jgi:hypothetical protein
MTIGSDTSFFNLEHLLLYINNIQIKLNINTQKLQSFLIIRKTQRKRNETKRNQQKRNETKRNQRNENEIKRNQRNQRKQNEIRC